MTTIYSQRPILGRLITYVVLIGFLSQMAFPYRALYAAEPCSMDRGEQVAAPSDPLAEKTLTPLAGAHACCEAGPLMDASCCAPAMPPMVSASPGGAQEGCSTMVCFLRGSSDDTDPPVTSIQALSFGLKVFLIEAAFAPLSPNAGTQFPAVGWNLCEADVRPPVPPPKLS